MNKKRLLLALRSVLFGSFTVFYSADAKANCELSWVAEVEGHQNWIHTIATYSVGEKRVFIVRPSPFAKTIQCQSNTQLCQGVKRMRVGQKLCNLSEPKMLKPAQNDPSTDEEAISIWEITPCFPLTSADEIAVIGSDNEMKFLQPFPLTLSKPQPMDPALEKTFRNLPELRKIKLREAPLMEIDLSHMPFGKATFFTNEKMKDSAIAEVKVALKMGDVPQACAKGCKNPKATIEFPLLFLKTEGLWKFFGSGMIGECSGDVNATERTLEGALLQPFGTPDHYVFYDTNQDGKADVLQLSSRPHLSGSVTLYNLKANGSVEIIAGLCVPSLGACFPEEGY